MAQQRFTKSGFLAALDEKIRKAESETWAGEEARDGFVLGLVTARSLAEPANGAPYPEYLAKILGEGFVRPLHAPGCRGHRHGKGGCLHRSCDCPVRPDRYATEE